MPVDYLQKILTAKVYDVAVETPLELAVTLSERLGNRVLLKREDQQSVFSFKLRGAYNKMAHLSAAERAKGVIAASAGNHAQGVALAAQRLGCSATIVMPVTTPHIKIAAVEKRGARVVLHGDSYSDAYAKALRAAGQDGRDVRPPLRRSRRHRRPGHDRHGDPAPVPGTARRDLRRRGRRRSDQRCRELREARAPRRADHRRAAGRLRCDDALARRGASRHAAARRPLRRRRRRQAGRPRDVSPDAQVRRPDDRRRHRCDMRGAEGRVRGHAIDPRACRRARDRRGQGATSRAPASGAARSPPSRAAPT